MSTQNLLKREIDGKADKGLFETLSQSYFNLSNSYVNNTVYLDTTQIITGQKVFHIHPYLPSALPSNTSQSVSRLHVENYLLGYVTTTSFNSFSSSFVNVSTSYASVSSSLNTRFTSQSVFIPLSNSFVNLSNSYYTFSTSFISFSSSVDQQIKDIVGGTIDTSSLVTKTDFNSYTSSVIVPLSNSFVNVSSSYLSVSSSFVNISTSYATVSSSLNTRFTSQSIFIPLSNSFVNLSNSYYTFSNSFVSFSQSVSASLANVSFDTSSLVTKTDFNSYTSSVVVPLSNSFVAVSSSLVSVSSSYTSLSSSYNSFSSSFISFSQSVSSSLANVSFDTSSLVTISDDQTITGLKIFNNDVYISASLFVSSSATFDKSINIKTSYSSTNVNRKNIFIGENINLSGGSDGYSSSTNNNIAIGSDTLKNINGFPSYNIAIGAFSGENLRAEDEGDVEHNVLIGSFAGRSIDDTINNRGNTIIGGRVIQNFNQSENNTIIGYNAMGNESGELRHSTILGANVNIAPDNGMVVLSDGQGNIRFFASSSGNVGIGTTTASHALTVNGVVSASSFIGDGSQLTGIGVDTSSLLTVANFNSYTSSVVVPLSNSFVSVSSSFVSVSSSYNLFSSSFISFSQSVSASLANISFDTSSLVTINTDQVITGIKTIANYLAFTNSATVDIGVPTTFPYVYDYNGENGFAIASRLNNESNYFSQTLLQNDSNVQKMFIGIVSGSSYSSTTPLSYLYFSNSIASIYAEQDIYLNADWIGLYSTASIELSPQGGLYVFTPSVMDVYTENYISLFAEANIALYSLDNVTIDSTLNSIFTAQGYMTLTSGDEIIVYAPNFINITTDALFQLTTADISTYSSGYVNIVSDGGLTFIAGSGSITPTTSDFVFKSSTPRFLFSGSNPYSNIYIIPESDTSYVVKKFVVDNFTSASTFTAFSASVSASLADSGGGAVYSASIGNNSATVFTITHNLDKTNIYVTVRENPTGSFVYPDIYYSSSNVIALTFVSAPTTNQYLVSVLGA